MAHRNSPAEQGRRFTFNVTLKFCEVHIALTPSSAKLYLGETHCVTRLDYASRTITLSLSSRSDHLPHYVNPTPVLSTTMTLRVFTPRCWSAMDSNTPLLGQVTGHIPPIESDIFLQVVESPWAFISGRYLFLIRISLATAMSSVLVVYFVLEIIAGNGEIFIFRLMNLAWAQQCLYMWLTSVSLSTLLRI